MLETVKRADAEEAERHHRLGDAQLPDEERAEQHGRRAQEAERERASVHECVVGLDQAVDEREQAAGDQHGADDVELAARGSRDSTHGPEA